MIFLATLKIESELRPIKLIIKESITSNPLHLLLIETALLTMTYFGAIGTFALMGGNLRFGSKEPSSNLFANDTMWETMLQGMRNEALSL